MLTLVCEPLTLSARKLSLKNRYLLASFSILMSLDWQLHWLPSV